MIDGKRDRPETAPAADKRTDVAQAAAKEAMKIAVFCSATENLDEKYADAAKRLGDLIVERGYELVWGGSDSGLMAVISRRVEKGGGKIHGFSLRVVEEQTKETATTMHMAEDFGERMSGMLDFSDALIALPGGYGTLLEIAWVAEHKRHDLHNKPLVVINTDGFFDPLRDLLDNMTDAGMIHSRPWQEVVHFVDNSDQAIGYVDRMFAEAQAPRQLTPETDESFDLSEPRLEPGF